MTGEPDATQAPAPAPAPQEPPPPPEEEKWPDSLRFWLLVTFATIAVPSLLCAGGFHLLRRLFFSS